MYRVCVLFITRLEVIQFNVIGHNRLNTPIASAYAVIRLHTSVKSSSTLHCIPRRSTLHHKMAFNVLFATAVLCLTVMSLSVAFSEEIKPIDEPCLGCLCEANGECSPHMKCRGEVCGMFGITWAYWSDSGRPVVQGSNQTDSDAYHKCANDATCARTSVIGYMKRFAQDCNNDGVVDCYDYAAIHKLGGYGCKSHLPHDYQIRFKSCQLSLKELSG